MRNLPGDSETERFRSVCADAWNEERRDVTEWFLTRTQAVALTNEVLVSAKKDAIGFGQYVGPNGLIETMVNPVTKSLVAISVAGP